MHAHNSAGECSSMSAAGTSGSSSPSSKLVALLCDGPAQVCTHCTMYTVYVVHMYTLYIMIISAGRWYRHCWQLLHL